MDDGTVNFLSCLEVQLPGMGLCANIIGVFVLRILSTTEAATLLAAHRSHCCNATMVMIRNGNKVIMVTRDPQRSNFYHSNLEKDVNIQFRLFLNREINGEKINAG